MTHSYRRLTQAITATVHLSPEEQKLVESLFTPCTFANGETIPTVRGGHRYAYFVDTGIVRTFLIDDDGVDKTLEFAFSGGWAGDIHAFLYDVDSRVTIACVEEVHALRISFDDLNTLFQQVPATERYFRTLYSHAYAAYFRRITEFIGWSAKRRYRHLLDERPELLTRVPLKYIASYIGVTPESLSRIRKKVSE